MTVKTQVDLSRQNQAGWQPKARRQGESCEWREQPQSAETTESELIFPPISPPRVSWPRVFPGL